MISLRDNFNPVKREEIRERGREGGKDKETDRERRRENIITLCLQAKKCQTTKILA